MANIERRITGLLTKLSLAEKALLVAGRDAFSTAPIERLGIPSLVLTDGPHGVRIHGPYLAGAKAKNSTAFPTGTSFAASWNPALVEKVGVAMGEETRAFGWHALLGPCINIIRHPLGGRSFEGFSEDPYLAGRLAVAYVRGVQSAGVAACLKHFACNNQEFERVRGNSVVDERTLREIYLPAFEAGVKEARPWSVMCAYNRLNGEYAAQNRWLLTDVLREEWGFDGVVMSDWGAVHDTLPTLKAGLDLEMPGPGKWFAPGLITDAVQHWQLDEAQLDEACRRVLRFILRCRQSRSAGRVNTPGHQRLARQLAEEAITLLKNDRALLPLRAGKLEKVAVIGPNAANTVHGGGGSSKVTPPYVVSVLDGLRARLLRRVKVVCENGNRLASAARAARRADAAIVVVGATSPEYETEGRDRERLDLPGRQNELVRAVAKANPNTIVVVNTGAPVTMPWIEDVRAVLLAYYPGMEGGNAIARILLGEVNPSGKLPFTMPKRLEDTPALKNYPGDRDVVYREGVFVGYRHYDKRRIAPLFPFGHGLSYTTFEYRDLRVTGKRVTVKVQNIGSVAGKEVVQLYVSDRKSSVPRPPKELKGLAKIELKPGQTKPVNFTLDRRAFAFYDVAGKRWRVEAGAFEILVGSSSRDIRQRALLRLPHEAVH